MNFLITPVIALFAGSVALTLSATAAPTSPASCPPADCQGVDGQLGVGQPGDDSIQVSFRPDELADSADAVSEPVIVDLAICLDTSGSMEKLIDAAREKLWTIVNELATATPTPQLRIGLISYGNDGYVADSGWVRVLCPFTEDLDLISDRLFELQTNGGTEYVARAVSAALELEWSESDGLKLIVVAGNESAEQDPEITIELASSSSIARGIFVNTLFCGSETDPIAMAWRDVSKYADGYYASIDPDSGTISVATPFDQEMIDLSGEINATTIPFGTQAEWGASNQKRQDKNVLGLNPQSGASRAMAKCQTMYRNGSWDLVDAYTDGSVDLAKLDAEALPEELRTLTQEELVAHIAKTLETRKAIQERIRALDEKRVAFIRDEIARRSLDGERSFDVAILSAIREQAEGKGLRFEPAAVEGTVVEPVSVEEAVEPVAEPVQQLEAPVQGERLQAPVQSGAPAAPIPGGVPLAPVAGDDC